MLFALSLTDLLTAEKSRRRVSVENLGAVPLGVTLIVGPAVLSTLFTVLVEYIALPVILAILANITIAGTVFWFSGPINRLLGKAGLKTISKLAAFLLAAIAVTMARRGLAMVLAGT